MTHLRETSRRGFLGTAAATVAAPTVIPAAALGKEGNTAPSERIVLASIGWGMMGPGNTKQFLQQDDCRVVAICDLDAKHRQKGIDVVNKHYGNKDCEGYLDYRELLARPDLDAVMIAIPDHWHALVAVEAAKQGKDIYGEKPLGHTIADQQAIVEAVHANDCIWQTGSWQRSQLNFRLGAEIVRNGHCGKIHRVEVGLPAGHHDFAGTKKHDQPSEPPDHIHYDTWLGPAREELYIKARHHKNWRWNYNIGGGQLLDWIGHHGDIAHWGLGDDEKIGPELVEGTAKFPPRSNVWHTATTYWIDCQYPGGVHVVLASSDHKDIRMGTTWYGDKGWVYVNRGGTIKTSNPDWVKPDFETGDVKLYKSRNHRRNFLDCVKSREKTITPVDVAHHSTIPGHLGYIATALGRTIRWDRHNERIVNDHAAHRMLDRPYREPWQL